MGADVGQRVDADRMRSTCGPSGSCQTEWERMQAEWGAESRRRTDWVEDADRMGCRCGSPEERMRIAFGVDADRIGSGFGPYGESSALGVRTGCRAAVDRMRNGFEPNANPMGTECGATTERMRTRCRPHGDGMGSGCGPNGQLRRTERGPDVDRTGTSVRPNEELCERMQIEWVVLRRTEWGAERPWTE